LTILIIDEDKGEIFRKSVCCITYSDNEESDAESNNKDNQKTEEQQKSEGKPGKSFSKRENEPNKKVSIFPSYLASALSKAKIRDILKAEVKQASHWVLLFCCRYCFSWFLFFSK